MGSRLGALGGRLRRPLIRALVGLGVSTVFIVLFLRNTDFGTVGEAFGAARVELIVAAIGVYFAGIYLRAMRWHYLLRPVRPIAAYRLFPIVAIGFGTNNVLPLRTGEVVRAHVLHRRHGVGRVTGLASIFMARVFDGLALTIFLCVGVAASLVHLGGMRYAGNVLMAAMAFLVVGVTLAFVLLAAMVTHPAAAERRVRAVARRVPGLRHHAAGWVLPMLEGFRSSTDRAAFAGATWTSAGAWGLEALMYYFVGEAFGLGLPFPVYLLVAATANIIITAPTTSGGVGPFEWATKAVLVWYLAGENAEERAIAYAAALHGLVLIPIALVGLVFLWLFHVPLRRLGAPEAAAAKAP